MKTLLTARLSLRPFTEDDADFIVVLLNDPDRLRYIGDKQVRTRADARDPGYARKAAAAARAFGFDRLALRRVVAISDPANAASARVLNAAGLHFERTRPATSTKAALDLDAVEASSCT